MSRGYQVNGLNQYTAAGPQGAAAPFGYDLNGNLTSTPAAGGGSTAYLYDTENRLVQATTGGTTVSLSYDPNGRLWQVSAPSGTTRFLYDGDRLVMEYDRAGTLLRSYTHGAGADEPLVWYEPVPAGVSRRFLHADHQGSIVAVADQDGNKIAVNGYDAWGIPNANNQGRFGYTGQAWIPELGLWYYKARFYSPTLGRFLQTDPIGYKDQVNLYAYVGNDPADGRDPSGLAGCDPSLKGECPEVMAAQAKVLNAVVATRGAIGQLLKERASHQPLSEQSKSTEAAIRHNFGSSTNSVLKAVNSNLGHLENFLRDPGRANGGMFDWRAPAREDGDASRFVGAHNPLYRTDTVALNVNKGTAPTELLRTIAHEPLHVWGVIPGAQGEFLRGQAITLAHARGGTSYAIYHNPENYACLLIGCY